MFSVCRVPGPRHSSGQLPLWCASVVRSFSFGEAGRLLGDLFILVFASSIDLKRHAVDANPEFRRCMPQVNCLFLGYSALTSLLVELKEGTEKKTEHYDVARAKAAAGS